MNGLVLAQPDEAIRKEATRRGLAVASAESDGPDCERVLMVGAGVAVPWGLLDAGFHFVERWDAAAPLWRYGVLAADVGTPEERERTRLLTKDLRVPLYEPGLLFVRKSEAAEALLAAWHSESAGGADQRLAFLRALCLVKPLFLALPRSWLQEAAPAAAQPRRRPNGLVNLVHVEIAPGRSVCCRPDEVEMYKQRFAQQRTGRRC